MMRVVPAMAGSGRKCGNGAEEQSRRVAQAQVVLLRSQSSESFLKGVCNWRVTSKISWHQLSFIAIWILRDSVEETYSLPIHRPACSSSSYLEPSQLPPSLFLVVVSRIESTMKTAIFATLLAGAAAFAPAQTGKASTALRAFEDEVSFCKFTYLVLEVSFDRGLQVTIVGGRNLVGIISGLHHLVDVTF